MDQSRPFSSSTLTMNEGHSWSRIVDRQGPRSSLPRHSSRRCSVLEDMYKNPQQYAGILEDPTNQRRGVMKQVMLSSPMFASEFCRTFSFVFMLVNLEVLGVNIGQSVYCCLAAGAVCIISICGFRWLHKRMYYSKKFKIASIICYNAFLVVGLCLLLKGNEKQYSSCCYSANGTLHLSVVQEQRSTLAAFGTLNNRNVSSQVALLLPEDGLSEDVVGRRTSQTQAYEQNETNINNCSHALMSFDVTIIVCTGYVMTTLSLVGGHYILQSLFLSVSHSEDRNCVISIIVGASTTGTCAMGILGAVNIFTPRLPSSQDLVLFFRTVSTLASLTICLIIVCTVCSMVSTIWPCGLSKFSIKRRGSRHSSQGTMPPTERRSTRTAQEIYDECAPLLRKLEHAREHARRESFQENEDNSQLSHSESVLAEDSTESAQSEIVARYSVPVQLPSTSEETVTRKFARRRHFILAVLIVFLTSGAWLTVEFYSSFYLLHVIYESTDSSNAVSSAPRMASVGALLMSISQLPAYILCRIVFPRMGDWKKMALGMTMLAFSSILGLALSTSPLAYFVVMLCIGPVRVLVMGLPLLLTSQQGRSQIHTEASVIAMSFLTIPTTFLLSTIPASYMVTSLLMSTLTQVTNHAEISVYFSATFAVLASCCFYILI